MTSSVEDIQRVYLGDIAGMTRRIRWRERIGGWKGQYATKIRQIEGYDLGEHQGIGQGWTSPETGHRNRHG